MSESTRDYFRKWVNIVHVEQCAEQSKAQILTANGRRVLLNDPDLRMTSVAPTSDGFVVALERVYDKLDKKWSKKGAKKGTSSNEESYSSLSVSQQGHD